MPYEERGDCSVFLKYKKTYTAGKFEKSIHYIFIFCFIEAIPFMSLSIYSCASGVPVSGCLLALASILTFLLTLIAGEYLFRRIYRPLREIDNTISNIMTEIDTAYFEDFASGVDMRTASVSNQIRAIFQYAKEVSSREYASELLKKRAEYSALQSQINPHFLYNSLESIRGQALIDQVPKISMVAAKLSAFFHYNISSEDHLVTLEQELNNIRDYFYIQQFRFEDKFSLQILCDDNEALNFFLPKLVLQPIVENSIHHGLETKAGKGHVKVRVTFTETRLLIIVSDDGIGMCEEDVIALNDRINNSIVFSHNENQSHSGIALRNINQRIKLYFGPSYGLYVSSTPTLGTESSIVLPLVKENFKLNTQPPSAYGGEA